jgi:hypothetical protein
MSKEEVFWEEIVIPPSSTDPPFTARSTEMAWADELIRTKANAATKLDKSKDRWLGRRPVLLCVLNFVSITLRNIPPLLHCADTKSSPDLINLNESRPSYKHLLAIPRIPY